VPETIHVAYALDDNYTEFTCTSMTSLLHNTKRSVHFHVLVNSLSEANKQILCDIGKHYPHGNWTFYYVERHDRFLLDEKINLTQETYFRLYLPELLYNLNKILWMDGDTIINDDISNLYDIELGDYFIGAVIDTSISKNPKYESVLKSKYYFNAGVMLCNIKALKNYNLFYKVVECISDLYEMYKKNGLIFYSDQEVLNYILYDKVKYLPYKFNFIFNYEYTNEHFSLSDYIEAFNNPTVIHYGGSTLKKISKLNAEYIFSPFWELYYKYKAYTAFSNIEIDTAKIACYHKREQNLDKTLIEPSYYIAIRRYYLFLDVADLAKKSEKIIIWGYNKFTRLLVVLLEMKGVNIISIVDGLQENYGKYVFNIKVTSPDTIRDKNEKYFVLLAMETEKTANKIKAILKEYGYRDDDIYHIYSPVYELLDKVF